MVLGIGAIILFNVVDTIFVGQLGADALAAMSFTFPVTSIVMSLAQGLGMGLTSVVSRLIGEGDEDSVRRITTHGLLLANTIVVLTAASGEDRIHGERRSTSGHRGIDQTCAGARDCSSSE